MKKMAASFFVLFSLSLPARADLFGGDVAVLSQILIQTIQQLAQLKEILGAAQGHAELVRQLNQGINDSLHFLKRIQRNSDPGIYRDWDSGGDASTKLEQIYGKVPASPEARIQRDTDQNISEAIALNNGFYGYTKELDSIGEAIQQQSHAVSPGGAAKLTAQALGLMIQVLNQSLRAQATSLKLHAQDLALKNRREKANTDYFIGSGQALKRVMKDEPIRFQVPRF